MAITIHTYNPDWKNQFEQLSSYLLEHLKNSVLKIEHIGSTAIPGLSAKPVIDLDIIIENNNSIFENVKKKLENLGYKHVGEMGISGRDAFKMKNLQTPIAENKRVWFKHNLYVCKEGSIGLNNHLLLKKHLLNHPEKVIEYSKLKIHLAQKFPNDMDSYIDGKTDFIIRILEKEGLKKTETSLIENENKKIDPPNN